MPNTRDIIGEKETLAGIINHTLIDYEDSIPKKVGTYKFRNNNFIQNISLTGLNGVVQNYFCNYCDGLNSVTLQTPTYSGSSAYTASNSPGRIVLSADTSLSQNTGQYNSRLNVLDISKKETFSSGYLTYSYGLCHLILRSESMCNLSTTNLFANTGIGKGIGWIYVPSSLVDTYKAASNWSNYASQIVAISEYPKRLQIETITDTWEQILASEEDGTYLSKYSLGDIKCIRVGESFVPMQIIGFDKDITENSTAHITWLGVGSVCYQKKINSVDTNANGWINTDIRQYLREIFYNQIESTVKNAIKPVIKTYYDNTTKSTLSCIDTVWIPSYREIFGNPSNSLIYEMGGCDYTDFFTDNTSRIKTYNFVYTSPGGYGSYWWLRSAGGSSGSSFYAVGNNGSSGATGSTGGYCVVPGFCT